MTEPLDLYIKRLLMREPLYVYVYLFHVQRVAHTATGTHTSLGRPKNCRATTCSSNWASSKPTGVTPRATIIMGAAASTGPSSVPFVITRTGPRIV